MTDAELTMLVTRWCEKEPTEPPKMTDGILAVQVSEKGFWKASWRTTPIADWKSSWCPTWVPAHDFTTDANAWGKVHAVLVERKRTGKYIGHLMRVLFPTGLTDAKEVPDDYEYGWAMIDATPRDRSEALAAMIGASDGE